MPKVSTAAGVAAKGASRKTKKAVAAPKKLRAKTRHAPTSEMVTNAIMMLKERGGSSLPAIKKYLAENYKVDVDRLAPFIKKYLKNAVSNGVLVQTNGKGAVGSFKLSKSIAKVKNVEPKEKNPAASGKVTKKPENEKAAGNAKKQFAYVRKVENKTKATSSHPPAWEMVTNAIRMLKNRSGSSLPAITKFIAENYNVDVDRFAPYIRKYLKHALSNGDLIQTKGKGLAGSFKLSKSLANVKSVEAQEKKSVTSGKLTKDTTGNTKKQFAYVRKEDNKTKAKSSHPPAWEMVTNAIRMLKNRSGSSLPAIKKYIAENYNVDVDRFTLFIKKYLKYAVTNGILIQTKGKGAGGSFKLSKSLANVKSVEAQEKKSVTSGKLTKDTTGNTKKQFAYVRKEDNKTKAKSSHPPAWEMVTNAIRMLKNRSGSSLPAIKKYIAENYNVDVDRFTLFIKKYLKYAVTNGILIQTKGKGAGGSFKLSKSLAKTTSAVDKPKKETALVKKAEKKKTAKTSEEVILVLHSSNSLLQNLQKLQQNLLNQPI